MGMLKEFREFAMKGNIIDLAVAVVLAGAFGGIISSLVDDILMPLISPLFGDTDWQSMMLGRMAIGRFLAAILKFIIIAFALFLVIKSVNRMMRKKQAEVASTAPPELSLSEKLLTEIRDSLRR